MARVENEPSNEQLNVPLDGPLIGGPAVMLDSGVPWPRRLPELEREWARLAVRIGMVVERQRRTSEAELTRAERYVLGARAAGRWTRGETEQTPATREWMPLSGEQLRVELATADALMEARSAGWEYSTGVVHWLLWITGAAEEMFYPGE